MPAITLEEMQQDSLAMSVALALAIANEAATAEGIAPSESLVTISEETSSEGRAWRVHYGPRDYIHRRGGDLTVLVGEAGDIQQVLRGQ